MMSDWHPCELSCYRCEASLWALVGEFHPMRGPRQDVVACAFCGARVRGPATRQAYSQPLARDGFRFKFGRFAGLTVAEADAGPNGRRYLEAMLDENEKLRPIIAAYLEQAAPSALAAS